MNNTFINALIKDNMLQLNKKGFTLIELLVVIAIIGVLGSIVFAPFNEARKKGRDGKRIAELKGVQSSLLLFSEDASGCFPDGGATSGAANAMDASSNKYMTKTLYGKVANYNSAASWSAIDALSSTLKWTAISPYMYRSVGDASQCTKTTASVSYYPYYQLMVELETHSSGLDGDADSDMSGILGKKTTSATADTNYDGLNNLSTGAATEACASFATGSHTCVFDLSNL